MTITDFFRSLRAVLVNARWSWGAVRADDNFVFLRVWQDEKIKFDGKWFMRLTASEYFANYPGNRGWQERLRHIDLLRNGAPTYMVMCEAVDVLAIPRVIQGFDRDIFLGGQLREFEGDFWLEMVKRVQV